MGSNSNSERVPRYPVLLCTGYTYTFAHLAWRVLDNIHKVLPCMVYPWYHNIRQQEGEVATSAHVHVVAREARPEDKERSDETPLVALRPRRAGAGPSSVRHAPTRRFHASGPCAAAPRTRVKVSGKIQNVIYRSPDSASPSCLFGTMRQTPGTLLCVRQRFSATGRSAMSWTLREPCGAPKVWCPGRSHK